jgi:uncharacterized protein (DUF2267 family)
MAQTGLDVFDETLQITNIWLGEMMEELHTDNRHTAYQALRATFHALRDRITHEEGAHLSAQLPLLLRGAFYEGWHPANKPMSMDRKEFMEYVRHQLTNTDPAHAIRAAFKVIDKHVTAGEVNQVMDMLPDEIREFWPRAA